MNKKSGQSKAAADKLVKNIRRRTSRKYSAEEKIRIVLAGLRGEESIAALCRREGIAESLYYKWSKEFLEAGEQRPRATLPSAPHAKPLPIHPNLVSCSTPYRSFVLSKARRYSEHTQTQACG